MRDLEEFEKLIYTDFSKVKMKSLSLASHLIAHIIPGYFYVGFEMPSVEQLSGIVRLSPSTVVRAYSIMVDKGYLRRGNGVCAVICDSSSAKLVALEEVKDPYAIYDKCMKVGVLNGDLDKYFQRIRKEHYLKTLPAQQNHIYEPLILTFCEQKNKLQKTNYKVSNLYFMHDYQNLVRIIGIVLKEKGRSIIIPLTASDLVRSAFTAAGIKMIAVLVDEGGVCVKDLTRILASEKMCSIYLMPDVNDTDTVTMSIKRIKQVYELVKSYEVPILIDDNYRPWLDEKRCVMLDLGKSCIDQVIYIKPVSYMLDNFRRINIVAASEVMISKIRYAAELNGVQADYSTAFTINFILRSVLYVKTAREVAQGVKELKKIAFEIFGWSGYWKPEGLRLAGGPSLYISPVRGKFPADAYKLARAAGFYLEDPYENQSKDATAGLRAELAYQIGKKNAAVQLKNLEKLLRKMVEDEF